MNLLAVIEKLEELEKKKAACTKGDLSRESLGKAAQIFIEHQKAVFAGLPTLLTALREAIDLVETLEKVFEKYPMYARLSAEKMEPIGNPCTEFLKKWTTE